MPRAWIIYISSLPILSPDGVISCNCCGEGIVEIRDRRQKTFEFLNRLCLLISNPLPPPLLNRHPSFFLIQSLDFYTNIGLTSSYTIHTYGCTVYYLPIPYLFYTRIRYFFTVLPFNQKYIWSDLLFYISFVSMSLLALQWTFQDIMHVSLSRMN